MDKIRGKKAQKEIKTLNMDDIQWTEAQIAQK